MWLDEFFSWRLMTMPISEMIERSGESETTHPPLSYLLLRAWAVLFGDSEFALRSLAGICGTWTILGVFLMVRTLTSPPWSGKTPCEAGSSSGAALLAAALVALSVLQIHASQQVRMYSIGTFFFVWGSWALLAALSSQERRGWYWGLYLILTVAFCYTHHLALFLVIAQGLFIGDFLLFRIGPGRARTIQMRFALLFAVILVATWMPWLPRLLNQSGIHGQNRNEAVQWQALAREIYIALVGTFESQLFSTISENWVAVVFVAGTLAGVACRAALAAGICF